MGSMITLQVGKVEIDTGKNEFFMPHHSLFQSDDEDLNDYEYVSNKDDELIVERRPCLARSLNRLKGRLEMLGYKAECLEKILSTWFGDVDIPQISITAFKDALKTINWRSDTLSAEDLTDSVLTTYAKLVGINVYENSSVVDSLWFDRYLDPYLILAVLSSIEEYGDIKVTWNYADVLEGEYVNDDYFKITQPNPCWIVITEGTSDNFVIQTAINRLYPNISDFFDFLDFSIKNPFPGVGSIVAFCKGLSRIRYTGNMLIVLDNDSAGRQAFEAIHSLNLSPSIVATCLPDLNALKHFKTLGPTGENLEDINRRASSIECFLDFSNFEVDPLIRWTAFLNDSQQYQGELIDKQKYVSDFKARYRNKDYDWSKLEFLCKYLIESCIDAQSTKQFLKNS